MSGPIEIVAIFTPAPGKIEEIVKGLPEFIARVKADEPGCLRYETFRQINTDSGAEDLVNISIFKDMAAHKTHIESEAFKAVLETAMKDGHFAGPPDVKILKLVAGFNSR